MNHLLFILKSSLQDLQRNRIRTLLTSLGILIGVFAVVLLIALGLGLKNYIQGQFENLGTNLIIVFPGKIVSGGAFRSGGGGVGTIKFDEKDVLKLKKIKEQTFVVPIFLKTSDVTAAGKSELSDIYASTPDIFITRNLIIDKGRLFDHTDVEKRVKKAVLGPKIAEKLFGNADNTLNKSVRIENQRFTVVGVLKKKGGGGFGGPDFDSFVYIPYKSAFSFNPDKKFFAIYLKANSERNVPVVKESAKKILLKRYKDSDFSVIEQTEILGIVTSIFSILNMILVAIGSISLLVGGIGIMNIMYASVTERTREVGIRRAIGATKKDILLQFLSQALILSLFGGLFGILFSFIVVLLIQPIFPASLSPLSIIVALLVSSFIGIFFGVFPAQRAANLSPIEAIRYE